MECPFETRLIHTVWRRLDPEYKRCKGQKVSGPVIIHSVVLVNSSGEPVARGLSFCSPLDCPENKTGFNIALGRAVKVIEFAEQGKTLRPSPILRQEVFRTLDMAGFTIRYAYSRKTLDSMYFVPGFKEKLSRRPAWEDLTDAERANIERWRERHLQQDQAAVG